MSRIFVFSLLAVPLAAVCLRFHWAVGNDAAERRPARLLFDLLLGGGLFLALGPLIGYLATFIAISLDSRPPLRNLFSLVHLLFLPFAYWYSFVPATLAGMTAGALRPWLGGWKSLVLVGLIGALVATAFGLIMLPMQAEATWTLSVLSNGKAALVMWTLPGFVAALACSRLLLKFPRT